MIDTVKGYVGFSCFSPDCLDNTFSKLRKLLGERTGRPTPQIYADEIDLDDLLSRMGGVEWVEGSEPVEPEEWKQAGEIMSSYQVIKDSDPAWPVPTQESILREVQIARERREAYLREAASRPPKPSRASGEPAPRRYLTVEELILRLGLKAGGAACA